MLKPVVDFFQKTLKKTSLALSAKQNITVQVGNISGSVAIGGSVHTNGEVLGYLSYSVHVTLNPGLGVSSQTCIGVDFVPNVDSLTGSGSHISGTMTMPIPNTPISGDGALTLNNYPNQDGNTYHGISLDAGAAWPQSEIDCGLSLGKDYTRSLGKTNIYTVLNNWLDKLVGV